MNKLVAASVLMVTMVCAPYLLQAQGGAAAPPATVLDPTKQLIIGFFGFRGTRQERVDQYMTEDYVQHNPRFLRMDEFTGARGRQAWVSAGEEATRRGGIGLVALGGIPLRNPVILLVEGDLLHAVYKGNIADPSRPGQTYDAFAFETFRLRNGRFSEHWDQVRLTAGWMTPPPGRQGGAGRAAAPAGQGQPAAPAAAAAPPVNPIQPEPPFGCSATPARLAANKQLAQSFLDGDQSARGASRRASLLADDYVEHNPFFAAFNEKNTLKGRQGFIKAVESGIVAAPPASAGAAAPRTVDHVVAECDYVAVVWKQVLPDPDAPARTWEAFTFDEFRVRDGKLAEHWDSAQR